MTSILVLLVIYVLSAIKSYKWVQIAYSKDGRWSNLDTGLRDLFFMFMPVANSLMAFMGFFCFPYEENHTIYQPKSFNKFFKIKK